MGVNMQKLVFIVDDNDANLTLAASALENDYRVLTMSSAAKMFSLLGKNKIPSLIFLDIEMPEMNGMDALRQLKANPAWAGIPALFLTGHNGEPLLKEALSLGAEGVVSKPFTASGLLESAKKILD
jgi:putative two-component system response regulator